MALGSLGTKAILEEWTKAMNSESAGQSEWFPRGLALV